MEEALLGGAKIEKSMSHPELGSKSSILESHPSRHSDPGKLHLLYSPPSSPALLELEGQSDPKSQSSLVQGHSLSSSVAKPNELPMSEDPDPTSTVEKFSDLNLRESNLQRQNSPSRGDSDAKFQPPSTCLGTQDASGNGNVEQEDLEWDAASAFSSLVDMTLTDDKPAPVELDNTESTSTVPHLEFESRFESGNLRKAIQVCTLCAEPHLNRNAFLLQTH